MAALCVLVQDIKQLVLIVSFHILMYRCICVFHRPWLLEGNSCGLVPLTKLIEIKIYVNYTLPQTGFLYLLGVPSNITDDHPHQFCMESCPCYLIIPIPLLQELLWFIMRLLST